MSNNSRVVEVAIIGRNATATAVNSRVSQTTVQSTNPYLALTPPGGSDGQIQYNSNNGFAGASGFYYDPSFNQVRLVNGRLLLNNSTLNINGISSTGAIVITDNSLDVLKLDTVNHKLLFSPNSNIYFLGIGTSSPQDKVHISGGNLRVNGTGYFDDLNVSGQNVLGRISSISGYFENKTNFQYYITGVSTGAFFQNIPYLSNLSYVPKVSCEVSNSNANSDYYYYVNLTNITNTGFRAEFSDIIRETGVFLTVFVGSPVY